ncbi:hypothetical protein [Burkholderia ambifaria]|uniref:hypothetical protein n=1 Tax=Burkholderia ambifaria TaxID=152480 RepID=UPI001589B8AD|nr:hypothetical protein [Burkholderia ambifaria]
MSKILQDLITELRAEAAFNRSFVDGSRDRPEAASLGYEARRTELAEQRDAWADAVEKLLAASPVEQHEAAPCVHADDPKSCNRVRCQLGNKCVDDDMSPRQVAAAPLEGTGNGADERVPQEVAGATAALRECVDASEAWRIVSDVEDPDDIDPVERTMAASRRVAAFEAARKVLATRAPRTEVAGGAAMACPTCGGSQTTWKCTCEPMWEGYAPPSADAAAAPADCAHDYVRSDRVCIECGDQPGQPTADERAAFEVYMRARHPHVELYRRDVRSSSRFGQYCREFAQEMWELWQARAAASQPAAAAGQEAQPFGWAQPRGGNYFTRNKSSADRVGGLIPVYTAPPAQVATRQGLTDEQKGAVQRAIDWCYAMAFKDDERALRALLEGDKQ